MRLTSRWKEVVKVMRQKKSDVKLWSPAPAFDQEWMAVRHNVLSKLGANSRNSSRQSVHPVFRDATWPRITST